MRKASEQDYFPYSSKLVCYIKLTKDKEIRQIQNYVQEKCDIYFRVKNEGSCNLTTGFICTDTLIILDSPLCEGVFRSEN